MSIFATVKGYWTIGKWIALGLLALAAASFYMLWRSNVQTVEAQQVRIDDLSRERAQYAERAANARTDYNNMVTKVDARLDRVNQQLGDYAKAIAQIDARTAKSISSINQIRDQSNETVKAVLSTQLPQFACVLNDKFCEADRRPSGEKVPGEPLPAK